MHPARNAQLLLSSVSATALQLGLLLLLAGALAGSGWGNGAEADGDSAAGEAEERPSQKLFHLFLNRSRSLFDTVEV